MAARLVTLRVRIPPGAWMFVLLYSKDKRQKSGHKIRYFILNFTKDVEQCTNDAKESRHSTTCQRFASRVSSKSRRDSSVSIVTKPRAKRPMRNRWLTFRQRPYRPWIPPCLLFKRHSTIFPREDTGKDIKFITHPPLVRTLKM